MTAPAAMPSVEDVARIICRRVHEAICPNADDWRPGELERKVDIYWPHYTREASAVLDLFAPILAEKERAERDRCIAIVDAQVPDWVKERSGPYWEGYRDAMEDAAEDMRKGAPARAAASGERS